MCCLCRFLFIPFSTVQRLLDKRRRSPRPVSYGFGMDVDARDLQQHLSEHLRRVAAGETIRVIEHGVPVALISPASLPHSLQQGVDEGWIRPPQRTGSIGVIERTKGKRRIVDVLAEDRGD